MIKVGLYIDNMKADMFEDVSVSIKDSIKKASDVGTLFTAYSRQFRLPASKQNNKIFKHFDKFDVIDGFDARRKHTALITLNGADYQKGYIKLNEVERKDNKAFSYSVQFFGELTTLKDQFGEDMLEDLEYLDRFNHEFNSANVVGGFEKSLKYNSSTEVMDIATDTTGEVVYPFLTHTKGFQFDTTNGLYDVTVSGTPASGDRMDYIDLKPAVKVREIITAIEDKYDITFGGTFIDTDFFNELFLWCHKSKGGIVTDDPTTNVSQYEGTIRDLTRNSFTADPSDNVGLDIEVYDQEDTDSDGNRQDWDKYKNLFCNEIFVPGSGQRDILTYSQNLAEYTYYDGTVTITPVGSFTADYNFFFFSGVSNQTWIQAYSQNGTQTFNFTIDGEPETLHDLQFRITSDTLDEFNIEIDIDGYRRSFCSGGELTRNWNYDKDVTAAELITVAKIPFNLPKMKVIDFMRGLFKMFNLTAYARKLNAYNSGYEIILDPLDEFYENGKAIDITRYVDISKTTVKRVNPYKTLKFEYEKPSTYLLKNANQISRFEFGNLTFTPDFWGPTAETYLFDGGEYKVQLPFEKVLYERLKDGDDDSNSELIYGWFVNDFTENTPEPEVGKPLIFLLNNRACTTDTITWKDTTVTNTTFNAPSNVSSDDEQTINWGAETDEFDQDVNENSLFETHYSKYIGGIYDITARRYSVTAYLPPGFLFNYRLNDKLIIGGTPFNIEEIQSDITTGKSQLELMKIVGYEETYDIVTGECYAVRDYVEEDYWCKDVSFLA